MPRSRTWITAVCTALGVSAGAGAAQLGIGYGLGVIAWAPASADGSPGVWYASLAWVTWLAATSTILGALVGGLVSRGVAGADSSAGRALTAVWQVVLALAAGIGALITVPLVALPARVAQQADNVAPQFTAGGYAVAGVIIGLVLAIGSLAVRAAAANTITLAALIWTVAIAAVTDGLRHGILQPTAQLGTWHFTGSVWLRGMVNLPAALGMLAIAFVVGALTAIPASRRGDNRVGVALSGAAGPVLVAAAYFLTTPGVEDRNMQLSAYVIAPYAVLAGLAGSVLVSAIGSAAQRSKQAGEPNISQPKSMNQPKDTDRPKDTDQPVKAGRGLGRLKPAVPAEPAKPAAASGPPKSAVPAGSPKPTERLAKTAEGSDGADGTDGAKSTGRFGRALSAVRFGRPKPADELDSGQWPGAVAPAQRAPKAVPDPTSGTSAPSTPDLSTKPNLSTKPDLGAKPAASTKPDLSTKPDVSAKPNVSAKPDLSTKGSGADPALFEPADSDLSDPGRQSGRKSSRTPSGR